jgi:hypothetical protein
MQFVNRTAQKILELFTGSGTVTYKKIDNAKGAFMAVTVEKIGTYDHGIHFSVAHYYEQNGDLMRDPEMIFIRIHEGRYLPSYYRQDPYLEQESLAFDSSAWKLRPQLQREHARFANMWMRNIKEQQRLECRH